MKPFTIIASVFFAIVAIVHLVRLFTGWDVTINGLVIPMWISVFGCVIPALFAFMLWREARA